MKHKGRVDVNMEGNNGATALHYAAWHNQSKIATLLVSHDIPGFLLNGYYFWGN